MTGFIAERHGKQLKIKDKFYLHPPMHSASP